MEEYKNEMTVAPENALETEAMKLHYRIKADIETASCAIYDFSESLKKMRDEKLYRQLGCKEFGEYTDGWLNIKERQAYTYIGNFENLDKDFLQSNAKLGVTKLQLLAAASSEERAIVMEANKVEGMSVRELKEALAQIVKLKQQIAFLEEQPQIATFPQTVIQQPMEEVKAEIEEVIRAEIENEYAERIAALEERVAEASESGITDDELAKYKTNAEKEAKAAAVAEVKKAKEESTEEVKKLKADLKAVKDDAKAKEELAKKEGDARKAAEEKLKSVAETEKALTEMKAKMDAAEAEKAAIEKQIKISSDPELTRFKFLFEAWQSSTSALTEQLCKLETDRQAKMKAAIKSVLEGLGL